jgi:phage host-nuclease inhibitor protein Gam
MVSTRRKAPRQQAPQTIEEATDQLGRYSALITEAESLRADADAAIARIEAARDAALAPIEEEVKTLFLRLRTWWAVAGDMLTEGKRRSVDLAGCVLGIRLTPPSLKMPGKAPEAAVTLVNSGWAELCRHKVEPDKPAILKMLGHDAAGPQLAALGFSAVQKEEFFIDRAGAKPPAVEEVQEAAE